MLKLIYAVKIIKDLDTFELRTFHILVDIVLHHICQEQSKHCNTENRLKIVNIIQVLLQFDIDK